MAVTRIRSVDPDATQTLDVVRGNEEVFIGLTHRKGGGSIHVNTAELHKALGIDKLGCGCDQADANLKAAIARAEEAEADSLEQAKLVREWADRAEKAEDGSRWAHAELAKAEAKLDLIDKFLECHQVVPLPEGYDGLRIRYDNIIRDMRRAHAGEPDPEPFELPTKAGVSFECKDYESGNVIFRTLSHPSGGFVYEYEETGILWSGKSVMEEMTDHRLIGSEA